MEGKCQNLLSIPTDGLDLGSKVFYLAFLRLRGAIDFPLDPGFFVCPWQEPQLICPINYKHGMHPNSHGSSRTCNCYADTTPAQIHEERQRPCCAVKKYVRHLGSSGRPEPGLCQQWGPPVGAYRNRRLKSVIDWVAAHVSCGD